MKKLKILKQSPERAHTKRVLKSLGKLTHKRLMIIGDNLERIALNKPRKPMKRMIGKRR